MTGTWRFFATSEEANMQTLAFTMNERNVLNAINRFSISYTYRAQSKTIYAIPTAILKLALVVDWNL